MVIVKKVDQNYLNTQILLKLLNAIWKAKSRGQKASNVEIFEGRLPTPLVDPPELLQLEVAADFAIATAKRIIQKGHGPYTQIDKRFRWEEETPGSINAGPGMRKFFLRISSVNLLRLELAREVNNEYRRIRRRIGKK